MAPGNKKRAKNRPSTTGKRAQAPTPPVDSSASAEGEDSDEPSEPMNRAERRLAAKQKSGRQAPTRAAQHGMSSGSGSVRGQGVNSSVTKSKGTNTRRSG